jgi:hypothetical protein
MTIGIKWLKSVILKTRNKIYELSLQPLVAFDSSNGFDPDGNKTHCFSHSKNSGRGRGKSSEKERCPTNHVLRSYR